MYLELRNNGMFVEKQKQIKVFYNAQEVSIYYADLVVTQSVIVELKAAEFLCLAHEFQLINYLKATDVEVGLLLNFGKSPQFKRKIFSSQYTSSKSASSAF